jgi:hypothetical protein
MFHAVGLMPSHSSANKRFGVDGANAAKAYLASHGIASEGTATVWAAIALALLRRLGE